MLSDARDELEVGDLLYEDHKALMRQGDACAEGGDHPQAERCYDQAALLALDQPGPYLGLGTIYLQAGKLDKAEWAFRFARRIRPDCAEALGGLAMVHQHRRAYPPAFEMYLKCLELDGDNLVALLGLFQTSCQMGTFSMITQYLERYLRTHRRDSPVLFCLATLYAREDKLLEAREALTEVLKIEPGNAEAARVLAAVEARLVGGGSREAPA